MDASGSLGTPGLKHAWSARRTFFHSKSSTGATPHVLIPRMATALKTNCAVETRPGSGSALRQSLLMRSIEAEDIEYMTIAEMDVLVSLPVSSGILFGKVVLGVTEREQVLPRASLPVHWRG